MLASTSACFLPKLSVSSWRNTSRSISSSAASTPAYMMFFIRIRLRTPTKFSLQIFASGTPRIVMSSRFSTVERGHVES